jgi:uncharacterized membrane protein
MIERHNREYTRVIAPAALPYDLDQQTTPVRAGLLAGGMVAGAVVCGAGLALTRLGAELRDVGAWAWVLMGGGLALAGLVVFVLALVALVALVWYELESRRRWTQQAIWERQQSRGLMVQETFRESDLRVDDPRHVLAAAVALYWQARYADQQTPWSVRELRRLELSTARRSTLIATCSEAQARQLGELLSRAGVLSGRRERVAGFLAVADADELLERLVPVLGRLPALGELHEES